MGLHGTIIKDFKMKRILLSLLLSISFLSVAHSTEVLYILSSGEVIEIAETQLKSVPNEFQGVLTDPPLPDGSDYLSPDIHLRVLGYAKINDNGTVRNATQQEIDTFASAEIDDRNQRMANLAINLFENDEKFRRIMIAFASILVNEFNILRAEHGLPDRTLEQLKTAIKNRISKDD